MEPDIPSEKVPSKWLLGEPGKKRSREKAMGQSRLQKTHISARVDKKGEKTGL